MYYLGYLFDCDACTKGGNQRELARAKNAKKQASLAKSKAVADKDGSRGAGLERKKERDAEIMREKQKKAVDKK